ncbi:MAG TPA: hypothetical protein VJP41_09060, partial [Gaiellaceae bacterium]|nr:hypothetical protein [Gaiellaceae bacterium]
MRSRLLRLLPVATVLAVLAFPGSAAAGPGTTILVGPSCSLNEAVQAANTNTIVDNCPAGSSTGSDTIDVPAGTYDLTAELVVSSDMTIVGAGARSTDIRGFSLGSRLFRISSGTVTIGGVTIQGGDETAGSGNNDAGVGGGIWIDHPASLTLQDSMVTGNSASTSGGGI